jgi:hypothetical protein
LVGIPVCREGEAVPIAAGLYAGGKRPVVFIQSTGFFESGDSIRGLAIPLGIPLPMVIGYRGYRKESPMTDTAAIYIEPILKVWGIKYHLVDPLDEGRFRPPYKRRGRPPASWRCFCLKQRRGRDDAREGRPAGSGAASQA